MMIRIHNMPAFRAAHSCIAKHDVRKYINYLLMDLQKGVIVGTDGHRCCVAPCIDGVDGVDGRYLIKPQKKIPKRWHYIDIDTETSVITGYVMYDEAIGKMICDVSNEMDTGKYPDYERVMPEDSKPAEAVEEIGFNVSLISDVMDAGGAEGVRLKFHGPRHTCNIKFLGNDLLEEVKFAIMPMDLGVSK